MEAKIKKILASLGADICGIANIERFKNAPSGFHPRDVYEDCNSVIVFAKCLPKVLTDINPRILYHNARDINMKELDRISFLASVEIQKLGGTAVPVPSDSPYEYWDSENMVGKGLISMRHSAILAGIGSMGKNTLVLSKEYGNMIEIGAVLTNLDLNSDPLSEDLCIENCRLCLDNCPQKALDGKTVTQKLCRVFAYGTNERGFDVCNCNRCRVVCPMALGQKKQQMNSN